MADAREIELVFELQDEGGYHVYDPDLPGLHTQGDEMADAMTNAGEAVALYVEGLREDGEPLELMHENRTFYGKFGYTEDGHPANPASPASS